MDDREKLAHDLVLLIPLLMRTFGVNMRCYRAGLAPAHYRILGMLAHEGGSVSQLAERHAVTMATMSNSITTLVERGFVERVPSQRDRRVVQISITPAGEQALLEMHAQIEQYARGLFEGLPAGEINQISQGLTLLRHILEDSPHFVAEDFGAIHRGELS